MHPLVITLTHIKPCNACSCHVSTHTQRTYTPPLLPRPPLQDYGRDEDAAVKALKKHGGLEEEAGNYM